MVFSDNSSLSKAIELNGSDLGGVSLYVDEAKPKLGNRDRTVSNTGRSGRGDSRGRRGRSFGRGDRSAPRGRGGRSTPRGRGGRSAPVRQSVSTPSTL